MCNAVKQLLVPDFSYIEKKSHQVSEIPNECEISHLKSIEVLLKKLQVPDRMKMRHNKIYYPTDILINDNPFPK